MLTLCLEGLFFHVSVGDCGTGEQGRLLVTVGQESKVVCWCLWDRRARSSVGDCGTGEQGHLLVTVGQESKVVCW